MDESSLKNLPPFSGLSSDELRTLADMVEEYSEPAGTTLIGQGDYGYEFIVLQEGTVDVIHDGERVDGMGPGDFFGEASLNPGALRNSSVVATSPVRFLALSAHNIRVLHQQIPALADQIDSASAERRR